MLFGACWIWNPQHLATESSERGVQSTGPASWVDVDQTVLEAAAGTKDRPSIDGALEGFFSRTRKVLEEIGGQYVLRTHRFRSDMLLTFGLFFECQIKCAHADNKPGGGEPIGKE